MQLLLRRLRLESGYLGFKVDIKQGACIGVVRVAHDQGYTMATIRYIR